MDVASVHSQQLEKKIKQFDKVWIEQDCDDDYDGNDDGDDVAFYSDCYFS